MKKNILNSLLMLAIVLFVFGCKPKKVIVVKPPVSKDVVEVKEDKKAEHLARLKSKDLLFTTLSLKGKANLNINGDQNNVTLLIRIQKDQKIWLSVTAIAGIEVVRAVITPDSILLRNNLQKTFAKKPFNYIHQFTNEQVNFDLLQAVFSGNTIPVFTSMNADLAQENGVWVLNGSSKDLVYRSLFNTLLKVAETTLNDAKAAQAFKVVYDNYTPVNDGIFPSSLKISSMAGAKKISVDLDFTKIETNVPVTFPFTVPKSFELID